ncbi:Hsp70 protein-domain-containing protein [Aspergillus karnatakaensis]|uniref:Hsp70 protein-domain-containing protein n=1 Tax=Aspergillus karnatakaensis TaxID=1810916 RepID=UPI003CCDE613
MRRPHSSTSNKLPRGSLAFFTLFLFLLFAPRASACGGYAGPPEKLIGIHLSEREVRIGAIKDGKVSLLTDKRGFNYEYPYVGISDGKPSTNRRQDGFAWVPNLFMDVMAISQQRAKDQGIFATSSLDVAPPIPPYKPKVTDDIRLQHDGVDYTFTFDEIYAPVLSHLLSMAESHIGPNITGAVVTIPPYFDDIDREHLALAGEKIGLPIIRQMHEHTSMVLSLGLDEESYTQDRYAVIAEIQGTGLDLSLLEIDMGVVDRLATLHTNLVFRNEDSMRPVIDQLMDSSNLGLRPADITDLFIVPPDGGYWGHQWGIKEYLPNAKVANNQEMKKAGVWGATLMAGWMANQGEGDWVPCCCATRRPPLVVASGEEMVQVLAECQSLPSYEKTWVNVTCAEGSATVKVYLRDIPCVDFHAQFEMGELYVPETAAGDILLGEIPVPAVCEDGVSRVQVEVFVNRDGVLKVRGVDKQAGGRLKGTMLTMEEPHFACGDGLRSTERSAANYTLSPGEYVEVQYKKDIRRLIGLNKEQKPTEAFGNMPPQRN